MLTTKEMAEKLGVSVWTLHNYVKDGRIPVIKLSKTDFRFDEKAVMEALKND